MVTDRLFAARISMALLCRQGVRQHCRRLPKCSGEGRIIARVASTSRVSFVRLRVLRTWILSALYSLSLNLPSPGNSEDLGVLIHFNVGYRGY